MSYKIQIGDARLSGSVVFEGDLEASSSAITGSNLSLIDTTSLAGSGLSDDVGRLRVATGSVSTSMINGIISTSKLANSSMNIAGITSTLGGSEPSASAVGAAIDGEPMAMTNIQTLDVFAAGDLTIFDQLSASLTIATSSTTVNVPGDLVSRGDLSYITGEFLLEDNYFVLNSNYTSDTALNNGVIMIVQASEIVTGSFGLQPSGFAFGGMFIQDAAATNVSAGTFSAGDLLFVQDHTHPINSGFYQLIGHSLLTSPSFLAGYNRWTLVQNQSNLAPEIEDIANADWPYIDPAIAHELTFYIAKVFIIRNNTNFDGLSLTVGSNASSFTTGDFATSAASGLFGPYIIGNASTVVTTSPHTIATSDTMTLVDSSGGTVLVRLPTITSSSVGTIYTVKDFAGSADVNGITIHDINYSDIDGNNSIIIESAYGAAKMVAYSGSSGYGYRIL